MQSGFNKKQAATWLRWTVCAVAIALAMMPGITIAESTRNAGIRQSPRIALDTDNAQLIQLSEPAKTVFVANPDIADIQVPTPTSVLVYGKKVGTTTVFAISETGLTTSYSIRVSRPTSELLAALRREVPSARVTVTAAPDGITLSGHAGSPRDAEKLKAVAKQFLDEKQSLNFEVAVDAATQVTLRVRVAEVSRNINQALGVNWGALLNNGSLAVGMLTGRAPTSGVFGDFVRSATGSTTTYGSIGVGYRGNGGQVNVSALIDALDQQGLATILAEPNLTATSGETANFLAGGEFPIPVPQGNQTVTVDYKRYGISVDFTPTVLDGNRISIKVRPEVSQLTTIGNLQLNGVEIPALTVRRVETTVELGSGESFAIAGLFQNNGTNQLQALPGLGDTPILGALFRSTTFQRNESELVIIVTPFIVRPVSRAADLHVPTEGFQFSSDIERILMGRVAAARPQASAPTSAAQPAPRLQGQAGFMLE
jgi:pilus assembly protein CpaC